MTESTPPLCLFGGTFNPVHLGHTSMAKLAAKNLRLDTITFLPCFQPVHKEHARVNSEHRLAMLELACKQDPLFQINSYEVDLGRPNYSIDSLKHFRLCYPDSSIIFMMGYDSLLTFSSWKDHEMILDYCHIAVLPREDNSQTLCNQVANFVSEHQTLKVDDIHQSTHGKVYMVNGTCKHVSSSQVRRGIQLNNLAENLLENTVQSHIEQHNLYQL